MKRDMRLFYCILLILTPMISSAALSTKAMNNKPSLKLKHVKHLSSEDIDKMSLDELKFHYYI